MKVVLGASGPVPNGMDLAVAGFEADESRPKRRSGLGHSLRATAITTKWFKILDS